MTEHAEKKEVAKGIHLKWPASLREKLSSVPRQQRSAIKLLAGFFVLMLLFTILSRIADSLTIPEVGVANPESGPLEYKISAQGNILAASEIPLTVDSGFMVQQVHVREGQAVSEGDPIITLNIEEIEAQLKKAGDELKTQELQAKMEGIASPDSSADQTKSNELSLERAYEDYEQVLEETNKAITKASQSLQDAKTDKKKLEDGWINAFPDSSGSWTSDGYSSEGDDALAAAQKAIDDAQEALNEAIDNQEKQLRTAQRAIEDAEIRLEEGEEEKDTQAAQKAVENQKSGIQQQITAITLEEKREQVQRLEDLLESGGQILAPADGYMGKVELSTGQITSSGAFAIMTTVDDGLVFQAEVTTDEAKHLERGLSGVVELSGSGSKSTISGVVVDSLVTNEAGDKVQIEAIIPEGKGEPGQTGTLALTKQTDSYSTTIPLSAIREDSEGKYVLAIREKDGILGTETVVERIPITVKEQDGTKAAIESALTRQDQVVTQTDGTLSEGDRVRVRE